MKSGLKSIARLAVIAFPVMGIGSVASAQINSNPPQPVTMTATLGESLTVSLSGNAVSFSMTPRSATNNGNTTITVTTKWVLNTSRNAVRIYAYFNSATAALSNGGGANIPSSAFKISVNGGAANALVNTVPFATNAGLQLVNVGITDPNRVSSRSDTLGFVIDLSALPTLPVGNYTGTLNIRAQATP